MTPTGVFVFLLNTHRCRSSVVLPRIALILHVRVPVVVMCVSRLIVRHVRSGISGLPHVPSSSILDVGARRNVGRQRLAARQGLIYHIVAALLCHNNSRVCHQVDRLRHPLDNAVLKQANRKRAKGKGQKNARRARCHGNGTHEAEQPKRVREKKKTPPVFAFSVVRYQEPPQMSSIAWKKKRLFNRGSKGLKMTTKQGILKRAVTACSGL